MKFSTLFHRKMTIFAKILKMKKSLILNNTLRFSLTIMLISVFVMTSCKSWQHDDSECVGEGFVYLDEGVFKVDGKEFFALMLNYKVGMMDFDGDLVFSAAKYYDNPDVYEPATKEEARDQFDGHMQLIKELGFNTVRLCIDVIFSDDNGEHYRTQNGRVYLKKETDKIVDAVESMISIVASHDLKVMLLLKPSWDAELADFNAAVMDRLSENPAIFAFDLMNEPLYFDIEKNRTKCDAVRVATEWVKNAKTHAPNHLMTIGFAEPIEVFSWDPSVLPVDFVEIHTYHPLSIPNETWWYSHYIGKPWMIGETSLPADNDSVTYRQQMLFAEQACQYVVDCGGIGFGWWEFQDIPVTYNMNYEGTFSGILNHEGTTMTEDGHVIQGTLKPVAQTFSKMKDLKKGKPKKSVNYYNNFGYYNAVIKGHIVDDETDEPVEGAAVRGWNYWWSTGLNTCTDKNGDFTLFSNDECVHFAISAPGKDTQRFDMNLEYFDENNAPADFSNLPDRKRKSSYVSFGPFLENEDSLFVFKNDKFSNSAIHADMGEIRLKNLVVNR